MAVKFEDLLLAGAGWHDGTKTITYAFGNNVPGYYPPIDYDGKPGNDAVLLGNLSIGPALAPINGTIALNPAQQAAATYAVNAWNEVANINAVKFGDNDDEGGSQTAITGSGQLVGKLGGATGFGENLVPRGDDFPSVEVNIDSVFADGIDFGGRTHHSLFVNINGTVSFIRSHTQSFPAFPFDVLQDIVIAPFWANVDTRLDTSEPIGAPPPQVVYDLDTSNRVFTVTWPGVDYYDATSGAHTQPKANFFQLQLYDRGSGDFDIVFRYQQIQWTRGSGTGFSDGLGGTAGVAGVTAGDGTNIVQLPASGNQNALLGLPGAKGNTGVEGLYVYQVRDGGIVGVTVGADIIFGTYDAYQDAAGTPVLAGSSGATPDDRIYGFATPPAGATLGTPSKHGDIFMNNLGNLMTDPQMGNDGHQTFLHEYGHAIGLSHPGDNGNNPAYTNKDTVMSYNAHPSQAGVGLDVAIFPITPMVLDIQAIQKLYGANLDTRTDNNTYFGPALPDTSQVYPYDDGEKFILTIWDAGGMDTINAANQSTVVSVNLSPGSYSSIGSLFNNVGVAALWTDPSSLVTYGWIENAIGGSGADELRGNDIANILDGGAANDFMVGQKGDDTYVVDHSGDTLEELADEGTDLVKSSVSFTLAANFENLTLLGTDAINGVGNEVANTIIGNAGANILDGGAGADTLDGGEGADTYVIDNPGDVIVYINELAGPDIDTVESSVTFILPGSKLLGQGFIENLTLTGNAAINGFGNDFDNKIIGNAGNNTLDGQLGHDTFMGGAGDDIYGVDAAGDVVIENPGQGTDTVVARVDYTLGDNLENLSLASTAVRGTGNALGNQIYGQFDNSTANILNGGAGVDIMQGFGGDDTYFVDLTEDVIVEGAFVSGAAATGGGFDTVFASMSYKLSDFLEALFLVGPTAIVGIGNDVINVIEGNDLANIIDGGKAADEMSGGKGNDSYVVDNAGDKIKESAGQGTDSIYSYIDYTLADALENLHLFGSADLSGTGNAGANVMIGNGGSNLLSGGGGDDTLDGQAGADMLTGGLGADTIVFGTGYGADVATDFALGTDKVNLSQSGLADFAAVLGKASQVGKDTVIDLGKGDTLTLQNVSKANLAASDFGFSAAPVPTTLSITPLAAAKDEGKSGTTIFTFTVSRGGDTTGTTTVNWSVGASGANGADKNDFSSGMLPGGTVVFAPGETSRVINVDVQADTDYEAVEGFAVTLSDAIGATIDTKQGSAPGLIGNDDGPAVLSISALDAVHPESDGGTTAFTFTITRSDRLDVAASASWAVSGSGGNPADAADFGGTLVTGSVSFAAGELGKTITVNVSGDSAVEANEGFLVTLSNPSASAVIGAASAAGSILNDDAAVSIDGQPLSQTEGDTGTKTFTFTVTLSGDKSVSRSVAWAVAGVVPGGGGNPANVGDFVGTILPAGTLTFAAGEATKTITIETKGDTAREASEGFAVTLSNPSAGLTIDVATATVTIVNDDATISLAALAAVRPEGNSGSTSFTFTATRAGDTSMAHSAAWTVTGSGSDPANGSDFTGAVLSSGTVSFAAGETSTVVSVDVAGDTTVELDETFEVSLSNPSAGLTIDGFPVTGTILNDDAVVTIVAASAALPEGNSGTTGYTFTLTRIGDLSVAHSVAYAVKGSGAAAAAAADFAGGTLPAGSVSFAAGETTKTLTILVVGDSTGETDEGFTVTLSDASAGLVIGSASASGTIQNDDRSVVSIAALAAAKPEGNSGSTAFTFTVSLAQAPAASQTVGWSVAGSATNPANEADFGGPGFPSGTLTFGAGETSKVLTVNVAGDLAIENDEGFVVTLANASAGLVLGTATAAGTIQADDSAVVAHDDAYTVQQNNPLVIAAAVGVLANDQSASSAAVVATTPHGTLQLSGNGGFTYTPQSGFSGIDSFTYRAGGVGGGQDAQAAIFVVPVQAGQATTLNLLALSADEQIAATYAAFFGRAADAGGHGFWVGEFVQNLPSQGAAALFANIASSFGVSDEAKALYPFLADPFVATDAQISAFIDSVYNNLFNRSSDSGGLDYWTGQIKQTLQAGQFVGSVLINIMSGAQDTAAGKDITTLMGKVAVSLEYVHEQQEHHTAWLGASDNAAATSLLDPVGADPASVLTGIRNAEVLIAAHP